MENEQIERLIKIQNIIIHEFNQLRQHIKEVECEINDVIFKEMNQVKHEIDERLAESEKDFQEKQEGFKYLVEDK